MNPLDMIIIVILSFCLIRGLFRGFVKEVSSIMGVLVGYYAAYTYYSDAAAMMSGLLISMKPYLNVIGFLAVFCGVYILVSLLGVLIKYVMKVTYLGWVDKGLGIFFGGVKGVLIVSVILIGLSTLLPPQTSLIKKSILSQHVAHVSMVMVQMVPAEMKKKFTDRFEHVKSSLGDRFTIGA